MNRFGKDTVFATYRVRQGKEREFLRLLDRHVPTLDRLGFTNGEPALVFRGKDDTGGPVLLEVFTWKDAGAVDLAHRHHEVAAIWEAMEPLVEERGGRRKWEFPHFEPVEMSHAKA